MSETLKPRTESSLPEALLQGTELIGARCPKIKLPQAGQSLSGCLSVVLPCVSMPDSTSVLLKARLSSFSSQVSSRGH